MGAGRDHVVDGVQGMHAHQHRAARGDVAFDQRHMLGRVDGGGIDLEVERAAKGALDLGLGDDLDEMIVAQPVGDQVGDGARSSAHGVAAKAIRSGSRAMVPSSFMISQITPAG